MNLSSIKSIWKELQQSVSPTVFTTASVNNIELHSLRAELIIQLNARLSHNSLNIKELAIFLKEIQKLESIIPQLDGNEQVFYAKFYRVCKLASESQ